MDQEADLKKFRSQLCLIVSGILHFIRIYRELV